MPNAGTLISMRKREVDDRVLAAVNKITRGGHFEDALIECKSEWPRPEKARQLAAHANSAYGAEIIWIIGVDEKTHTLTSPEPVDLANWWSEFSRSFDEVSPGLDDHIVRIGHDQFVTALVFSTDQAPYIIKTGAEEGRVDREVPIRSGTRTRSAKRHELLGVLRPASSMPAYSLVSAELVALRSKSPDRLVLQSDAQIFIDQSTDCRIVLPHHLMRISIKSVGESGEPRRAIHLEATADKHLNGSGFIKGLGILNRPDGLVIAGPAVATVKGQVAISVKSERRLVEVETFELEIKLNVGGTGRDLNVNQYLRCDDRRYWQTSLSEWRYRAAMNSGDVIVHR